MLFHFLTDIEIISIILQLREAISDVIVAYAVGAIWTLAFEYPVGILEEATFGPGGGKGVKKENKATRDISATEKGNISGTIATE